jgi:hypothetical protein
MSKIKLIKIDDTVIAVINDSRYVKHDVSDEQFEQLWEYSERELIDLFSSKEDRQRLELVNNVEKSDILSYNNGIIVWESVSPLSLPEDFAAKVLKAELEQDNLLLTTYRNFWTLLSLNPDELCRKYLFWFLNRNNMILSKEGFFVAYRNVASTEDPNVFTDFHSHTFKIRMGEMVTQDRSLCDHNHDVTCSKGLHLGAYSWLTQNYFGDTGMVCLCNPVDVIAVPKLDNYGKLRTCAYLPIDFCSFDENGNVIPYDKQDGFSCPYVGQVLYEGVLSTENTPYRITVPETLKYNSNVNINTQLLKIANESIKNRIV